MGMTIELLTGLAVELHTATIPAATVKQAELVEARNAAVAELHERGWTYGQIAGVLGCSVPYVQVMVQAARGTLPPSRKKGVKHA